MPVIPGVRKEDIQQASLVPDGTYTLRTEKVEYVDITDPQYTGQAKANYLSCDFVIEDEGVGMGRHIFMNLTLNNETGGMTRQFLDAIDYPEGEDLDTDIMQGRTFLGVVVKEKGKPGYDDRNRVRKFLPQV